MIEFYPQIKAVHVGSVQLSILLFVLRGMLMLSGRERIARALPVRVLSWSIDTVLLTAAMLLWTILPSALFANHWLALKLALLPVYVILGHMALRAGIGRGARLAWLLAALATIGWMYGIARTHHPLGWLLLVGT